MRILKKRNISIIITPAIVKFQKKCVLLTWVIILTIVSFGFSQSPNTIFERPILHIDRINIHESDNAIRLYCSFSDTIWIDQLVKEKARLRLIIRQQDTIFNEVTIKREEQISKSSMLLSIQPPLAASIYKTEKKEFTLQLVTEAKVYEAHTDAVLGSVIKIFDLRPYTITHIVSLLTKAIVIVIVLSFILMLITPMHQKYKFKKHHIKKYTVTKEKDRSDQDPFTFVEIQEGDKVVVTDDKMMLLSSWKRLNKLPKSKPAKEQSAFFKERLEGTFFDPRTENFKRINKAWYILVGIFFGWGSSIFLTQTGFDIYTNAFSTVFDTNQLQVTTIIIRDTIFGLTLGLFYSLMYNLAELFQNKDSFSYKNLISSTLKRSGIVLIIFFLQALIVAYVVQNFYVTSLITWVLIGVAFSITVTTTSKIRTKMIIGVIIGVVTYVLYLLLNTKYAIDLFGVEMPLLLCMLILGVLTVFLEGISIIDGSLKYSFTNTHVLSKKCTNSNKGPVDDQNDSTDTKTSVIRDNEAIKTEKEGLVANKTAVKEQSL